MLLMSAQGRSVKDMGMMRPFVVMPREALRFDHGAGGHGGGHHG